MGVVLLGEEAAGAQDDDGEAVLAMDEPANLLGGELGDSVDVARLERPEILGQPGRFGRAARLAGADRLARSSARWSR